jgi:hypothetical protein
MSQYDLVPYGTDREIANPPKMSDSWLAAQSPKPLQPKQLKTCLAVLQTAFPTVVRNYTTQEYEAMCSLWGEIFGNVPQEIFREAIKRFVIADRKGFFPTPGQIVEFVEQIIGERKAEDERIALERHWAAVLENERLIENGEHCGTCRYCEHTKEPPKYGDRNYDKYHLAYSVEDRERNLAEKLYCTNPESYRYEDPNTQWRFGTDVSIRCELYEPKKQPLRLLANDLS